MNLGRIQPVTDSVELSFLISTEFQWFPDHHPLFHAISFSPRILRLDLYSGGGHYEFGKPLKVWRHVEELHLTMCTWDVRGLGLPLARALSQRTQSSKERMVECYPRLRVLTVKRRCQEYEGNDLPQETKQRQTDQLIEIAKGRKESGLRRLEKLKIGWFLLDDEQHVLGRPSTERLVIEWRDCSRVLG